MDCSNCNRNAHYANRNGRNMSEREMNTGRSYSGNTMQARNRSKMSQNRNTGNNMSQMRNTRDNMNRSNSNCGCMGDMYKDEYNEGCDRGVEPVDEMMPGMGFVPWQKWEEVYCVEEAIENGTIFAQLNKPYIGRPLK